VLHTDCPGPIWLDACINSAQNGVKLKCMLQNFYSKITKHVYSHLQSCSEMPLTADIHQLGRLMVQCSWTCVCLWVKGSWSGRNESTDREETGTEGEGETWREPSTVGTESSRGASWHSPSWRLTMLNYLLNLRTHWQWKVNLSVLMARL